MSIYIKVYTTFKAKDAAVVVVLDREGGADEETAGTKEGGQLVLKLACMQADKSEQVVTV